MLLPERESKTLCSTLHMHGKQKETSNLGKQLKMEQRSIPMLFGMHQLPIRPVQEKLYPQQVKRIVVQLLLLYHNSPFAYICQEFK
jgi:hypothetical protein